MNPELFLILAVLGIGFIVYRNWQNTGKSKALNGPTYNIWTMSSSCVDNDHVMCGYRLFFADSKYCTCVCHKVG